ncbi:MAG: sugar ABC transporter ATP-binding protein [Gemmatimonadaceae bacterium]
MADAAVRFEGITKRFPGSLALSDVTLEIATGSCHALCGENGAGKSTLGRILAGVHAPDAGRLFVHGQPVRFHGVGNALAAGVAMVHQEPTLCPNLSVAENLCLAALPARRGLVDRRAMRRRAESLLAEVGAALDVTRSISDLSVAHHQLVQIATAMGAGARIVVFDEPTSSLSEGEAERLFELMGRLRERGITCIYVSHRMPEIFRLCDTVSVLRDGRHVATRPVSAVSIDALVQLMIGRPLSEYFPPHAVTVRNAHVLEVERLTSPRGFHDVTFSLRAGEVLGLCGLVGSGRSEVAAALFGLDQRATGRVRVGQREVRMRHARDAIQLGLGLVPEDRKRQGIVPGESARRNISLSILDRLSRLTWVRRRAEGALARDVVQRLRVMPNDVEAPVAGLSGGNQQKVVLGRWLAAQPRILILDEPTRGVDVGAKTEIHGLIADLASEGTAILLISSELPEILRLSHRILVLREGRIVGEVPAEGASQDQLMRLMSGVPVVA